jgi:hypothetical protein
MQVVALVHPAQQSHRDHSVPRTPAMAAAEAQVPVVQMAEVEMAARESSSFTTSRVIQLHLLIL